MVELLKLLFIQYQIVADNLFLYRYNFDNSVYVPYHGSVKNFITL